MDPGIPVSGSAGVTVIKESAPAVYEPEELKEEKPSAPASQEQPKGETVTETPAAQPVEEKAAAVKHSMKELTKKAIFEGIPCEAINPSSGERVAVRFAIDSSVHNFSIKVENGKGPAAWAEQQNELSNLTRAGPVAGTEEGDVTPRALKGKLSADEFARLCYVETSTGLTVLLCENSTDIPSCLRLLHFHRTQTSPTK